MFRLSEDQVDKVALSCINLYKTLPKTGKPVENEWTVLSCVVKYDILSGDHEVVSLGTGSKCVGASKMSPIGDILNDSHAEIFARRGFLLYIYDQLKLQSSIFTKHGNKFKLREGVKFIFYSSQLPCGDASIIPKTGNYDEIGDILRLKRQATSDICDSENKKQKQDPDIHRTGAKCLPDSEQDPKEAGTNYHVIGQVRNKPGRGDRTLSVSCSDKMARWIQLGVQGGLLDIFLSEPIFIDHFIFGAEVPFSEDSLKRALLTCRNGVDTIVQNVQFYQSSISFIYRKTPETMRPAPGSIVWAKIVKPILEVAVQGRKLGLTKKVVSPKKSLCISKYKLYEKFHHLVCDNDLVRQELLGNVSFEEVPYNEMKRKSKRYVQNWRRVKEKFFKSWTVKPDIWDFCLNT